MTKKGLGKAITEELGQLKGLKLCLVRRAASMRGFHFGELRQHGKGNAGEYILHVQCSWRLEGPKGIVTAQDDLFEPAVFKPNFDWDSWDWQKGRNLQDDILEKLLGGVDFRTGSPRNVTNKLVVVSAIGNDHGDATISMTGGYSLNLFTNGIAGEQWRLFQPSRKGHFIVQGDLGKKRIPK